MVKIGRKSVQVLGFQKSATVSWTDLLSAWAVEEPCPQPAWVVIKPRGWLYIRCVCWLWGPAEPGPALIPALPRVCLQSPLCQGSTVTANIPPNPLSAQLGALSPSSCSYRPAKGMAHGCLMPATAAGDQGNPPHRPPASEPSTYWVLGNSVGGMVWTVCVIPELQNPHCLHTALLPENSLDIFAKKKKYWMLSGACFQARYTGSRQGPQ